MSKLKDVLHPHQLMKLTSMMEKYPSLLVWHGNMLYFQNKQITSLPLHFSFNHNTFYGKYIRLEWGNVAENELRICEVLDGNWMNLSHGHPPLPDDVCVELYDMGFNIAEKSINVGFPIPYNKLAIMRRHTINQIRSW